MTTAGPMGKTHEAEVLLAVDAETPSTGPAAPQAAARGIAFRRRLVLAAVCSVLCAVPLLIQATHGAQKISTALQQDVPQELSEAHHQTDFGLVPDILHVSGFDCFGHNGMDSANGNYHFGGTTGEGRAYYVHDLQRWRQGCCQTHVLYYDKDCDRDDDMWGQWTLTKGKKEDFNFERVEVMQKTGKCTIFAWVNVDPGARGLPWELDQEPGPVPPAKAPWRVWCGDTLKWQVQTIMVGKTAQIHGQWQFLYSAMPDEKVTLRHGKREKTSKDRRWRTQGKDSIEVGGDVAYTLAFAHGEASHEVTNSLASCWSHETEYSTEVTREFKLPKDTGSAFYQWVLTATTPDEEAMDVLTQSFALTPDAAHAPRCYPGGSRDGYRYQKCNPGWHLP